MGNETFLQAMNPELATFLTTHYHLDGLSLLRVLQERGGRQTFLVAASPGKLVVKLTHPGRAEQTVAAETGILAHLARYAFPAPEPVPDREGRLYLPFEDRYVSIYRYLEGTPPQPDEAFYTQLGHLMARLHRLPIEGFEHASPYRPEQILGEAFDFLSSLRHPLHQAAIDELLEIITHCPGFESLPTGLIHTDPWLENLLVDSGGNLALIDWDDGGVCYPLLDVVYVVSYMCTFLPWDRAQWNVPGEGLITWRPDWARRFLQAYQEIRPLSKEETALFTAAVHVSFLAYIQDWETGSFIHENYQRMKIVERFVP